MNQFNENMLSSLIGNVPAAGLKGLFTGTSAQSIIDKDEWVNQFYSYLYNKVKSAIDTDLVDASTPVSSTTTATAPTSPAPTATPTTTPTQQIAQTRQQKQAAATAAARASMTPVPTTPKSPRTPVNRNTVNKNKMTPKGKKARVTEDDDSYTRLNYLFESIVEAINKQTLTDYINDIYTGYLKNTYNVNLNQTQLAQIKQIADEIHNAYAKNKTIDKNAFKKLSNIAYALQVPSSGQTSQPSQTTPQNVQPQNVQPQIQSALKQSGIAFPTNTKLNQTSLNALLLQIALSITSNPKLNSQQTRDMFKQMLATMNSQTKTKTKSKTTP